MKEYYVTLNKSQKRVLRRIRKWLGIHTRRYDFWFIEDINGESISWEGGWEIRSSLQFRDQYSIPRSRAHIVKNW